MKNILNLKNRGSVHNLTKNKKIGLFIGLIILQQIPAFIYQSFYYGHSEGIGLILSIIVGFLILKIPLSYNEYKKKIKIKPTKQLIIIIASIIIITILTALITTLIAIIGHLEVTNAISNNKNEEIIESYFKTPTSTLFILINSIIFAPIIEEFLFRGMIINLNKNKTEIKQKQIISIISFALLHTFSTLPAVLSLQLNIFAWIYINIPYLVLGYVFSTIYIKTNSLQISTKTHMSWNLFAFILKFI